MTESAELETFSEVKAHANRVDWMKGMEDEMKLLYDNHTYELEILPKGKRALKNNWVYKIKHEEGSNKPRFKASPHSVQAGSKTHLSGKRNRSVQQDQHSGS